MSVPDTTKLDLVLPVYNPPENWQEQLAENIHTLRQALPDVPVTIFLVNDGSDRGINNQEVEVLKGKVEHLVYINNPINQGKGAAVRTGVAQTTASMIIYTDFDFPYTTKSIVGIYRALLSGKGDVVIGERSNQAFQHTPRMRKAISRFLHFLIRNLLRLPTHDTQAGLKGFNKKGKAVFLQTTINRYLFDLEFVKLATRKKEVRLHIHTIELKSEVTFSKMNMKVLLKEGFNFMRILFKF